MSLPKGKYMPIPHSIPQQQRVPPNLANRGQTQQRPEDYSRQIGSYPQQASSFFFILGSEQHQALRQLATGSVQQIANSNPHDMSKQAALSSQATPTPGLYQQAQGPGPQLGMPVLSPAPGPSPTPGPLQPQQTQHIAARPISNIGVYYNPRSNTPRATHPMALTNPLSVGSATPSATTSQFPGIICAPPPIPFATSMPPQHHLFVGATPISVSQYTPQRPQFGPSPQYSVTTTQQPVFLQPGTPPFIPNPTHQAYYSPQMQIPVATASRPPLQAMAQPTANSFKKEKKLIRIQEPGTMRDVTEELMSAGSSGYSSARGTSPVESGHPDNHIAALFAAQVAARANGTSKSQLQNIPVGVEQQSSIVNTVIAEPQEIDSGLPGSDDFSESSVIVDESGPVNNRIKTNIEEISHKEEIESPLVTKEETMSNAQVTDSIGALECVCDNSQLLNDSHSTSIDNELCRYDNVTIANKTTDANCELQNTENYVEFTNEVSLPDNTNRNVIEREIVAKSQDVHHEEDTNKVIPHQILESQPVIEGAQDLNISPQNGEITVEASTIELKEVVEAKNKKNNKNKKRLKELNKKGESKEGGDMDAFLDREEELSNVITSAAPKISPISSPQYIETLNKENELKDDEITNKEISNFEEENGEDNDEAFEDSNEELTSATTNDQPSQITLKYNYTEDQWSPLNPGGKKKYDRSFLLQLQNDPLSLRKPEGLPELEVVKEKAIQHKLPEINRLPIVPLHTRSHPDLFMPNYATRTGISRMPSGAPNRRQSQPCRDNKPKKVIAISTSLTQDVKLHECEKAWKPSHKKEIDANDEEQQTQELMKKTRGILNKLTPQKFQSLVEQVKNLAINTEARLNSIIDLVFEKAIDEPNFSVSYANMCKHLALMKVPVSGKDIKQQQVNFRKLLLTKCQREFEKDVSDELKREERLKHIREAETEEKRKHLQEELEEEERIARRRSLGNIRFIGELFKLNMLTSPIMHDCVKKLIQQGDEDSLECLCRLLTTIGKELDSEKSKATCKDLMDTYFETMQQIVTERRTNSRVRFMLQDIIELRKRVWVPRRVENNPKTIDQIHREAEKEAHEQQLLLQQTSISKRSDDRERRKPRAGNTYSEEWTSVNKQSRNYGDPSKIRITKLPMEVENIQFGPSGRGFSNWGKGSSGGNKIPPQETETKTAGTNRYSALDQVTLYDSGRGAQRAPAANRDSSRGRGNQYVSTARKTPSPTSTSSKEREQVLAAVKDITKVTSDDKQAVNQEIVQPQEQNEQTIILRGENMSPEEMENKTKPLIDEFLHIRDFKEATQCFLEIASENSVPYFIMAAVNQVLERSSQARNMVGEFLHDLICKKIITVEQYIRGFNPTLEMAEDSAIDIPRIWEYLGEIIAPIVQSGSVNITFLKDLAAPCIASGTAGKLVAHILRAAAKGNKVGELWRASGLQWPDFLDPNEDVRKFIQDNNLEFTVDTEAEHKPVLSNAEIKKELEFLLQKKCVNNETVFDWIEANVGDKRAKEPQFIRTLVTAVMENAIDEHYRLMEDKVLMRVPLLQKYLDHDEQLELQAVYALQALMNQLSHPKDVLRNIFDFLYDEDLISEDAFNQWEQSTDAAEQEGKGVALKSVSTFFSWLKQDGEDYSEEN